MGHGLFDFPPFDWQGLFPQPVIGVDEVGRGCLAGRVYAAAVILQPRHPRNGEYDDSKVLTAKKRCELSDDIWAHHQVGVGFASVEEIAELNILGASLLAMRRAVAMLAVDGGHILLDGNQILDGMPGTFRQTALISGDKRAAPISAASIVAKVARDRYITEIGDLYPLYGFAEHKGYGTPAHREAIKIHGPCPEHRRTFAGVREFCVLPSEL